MSRLRPSAAAVALLLLVPISAAAQTAARPASSAEPGSAMKRAQQLAANPMRIIIEAGRIRRRAGTAEAPVTAPEAAPSTAAATAAGAQANPASPELADAAPAPAAAEQWLSAEGALARPAAAAVPPMPSGATAAGAVPVPLPDAAAPPPGLATLLAPPRLLSKVDPVIPQRVQNQIGRIAEVLVELSLRTDGSVAEVAIVSPAPRPLHRVLIDAIEQWRYEPQPAPRRHRVQLVFKEED